MYSTRSGRNQPRRYNKTGSFVSTGEQLNSIPGLGNYRTDSYQQQQQQQEQIQQSYQSEEMAPKDEPLVMDTTASTQAMDTSPSDTPDPTKKWKKNSGFKVSMREKRRRQNLTLRRLIAPKNALMILNELAAGSRQECTVSEIEHYSQNQLHQQYMAVLNMGGVEYSGTGTTKLMAKNQAAENIIRDMVIKQLNQQQQQTQELNNDSTNGNDNNDTCETFPTKPSEEEQSFPMIQLASYALHKLFAEWQMEGYKIPTFGKVDSPPTAQNAPNTTPKAKKVPTLPASPEQMHPCTLLCQTKGVLNYLLVSQEGVPPNGQIFTMAVTIDGKTYTGKAGNKKEARRCAAMEACKDLFDIKYTENPPTDSNFTYVY